MSGARLLNADGTLKSINQPVNIFSSNDLCHAVQAALSELREFAGDIFPAKDLVCKQALVNLAHSLARPIEVHQELLEERSRKNEFHSVDSDNPLRRILSFLHNGLSDLF